VNEISLTFKAVTFNTTYNAVIDKIDIKETKSVKVTTIPKTDGSIAETARRSALKINLSGSIVGGDYDALRDNIDGFKATLQDGLQKFTIDDDRYIYAQLNDFSYSYKTLRTFANWSASFIAHYPYWQAELASSDIRTPVSATTYMISNPGNAPARVKVLLTSGATSIVDDIKIENITNGQAFQYRGTLAGTTKVLEIDNRYDTDDFQVLNDSADDIVNFEGDFLEVAAGTNYIKFTGAVGKTVPEVALYFRGTWF
jgi:phage-related protein